MDLEDDEEYGGGGSKKKKKGSTPRRKSGGRPKGSKNTKPRRSKAEMLAAPVTAYESGRRATKKPINYADMDKSFDEDEFDDDGSNEGGEEYNEEDGEDELSGAVRTSAPSQAYEVTPSNLHVPWRPKVKILEKILCHRDKNKGVALRHLHPEAGAPILDAPAPDYQYYVKWKDFSYLHCEWVDADVIRAQHLGGNRLTKYHKAPNPEDPEEPFESRFVEVLPPPLLFGFHRISSNVEQVDRIISVREYEGKPHYLIKWSGLNYDEATWESADTVSDDGEVRP